jgi:hypothetical protein
MFGHFVSYLNRLGHRIYKYILRLSAHKVSRETQPRFPSKNTLVYFYLETEGCRTMV